MKSFLAMITPVTVGGGEHPDHTLPTPQPPVDPGYGIPIERPEHPIWYPLPPGAPVDPEYGVPEDGPHPDQGLPQPQPRPDHTLPGAQPHPEHPIVLPPGGGGWLPVYIWGPGDGRPTPPIVIPPDGETDDGLEIKFVAGWTPETGWVTVGIIVPGGPTPTPSKRKR